MPHQPVQIYAVEVPPGDIAIPAHVEDLPANLRITMAALDPSAPAQLDLAPTGQTVPRATLKIVKMAIDQDEDDEDDEDYDSDDIAALEARLKPALGDSEDDSEEEDSEDNSEEENGGPSDPEKSKQARKDAAVKALLESLKNDDEMDTDDLPNGVNGINGNKGKARASDDDEDSDLEDDDEGELEEYVICTLDTTQHYQQPIDITINEGEQVFFKVIGTHSVFLTGNYVADVHSDSDEDDSEDDMDYYGEGVEDDSDDLDEEIDELDDLADPRITEVDSEEEAPKLVKASTKAEKKGKNKRPAEDSEEELTTLDALISKSLKPAEAATNGEKLSKKQAKKLKNNQGVAVAGAEEKETNGTNGTPTSTKSDKKVQFAKNLEQGPTGSPLPKADAKGAKKDDAASPKSGLGVKMVQGVKIDDKKLGKGPAAKKGDKVGMRYIGKLENGKVFDSNKKGKPFTFGLGKGEVISGWDIGVAGMTVGGERRLTIPAKLAYGSKGVPGIPPNSTLVFDVKLITIN